MTTREVGVGRARSRSVGDEVVVARRRSPARAPSAVVVSKKNRCFAGDLIEPVVLGVAGRLPARRGDRRRPTAPAPADALAPRAAPSAAAPAPTAKETTVGQRILSSLCCFICMPRIDSRRYAGMTLHYRDEPSFVHEMSPRLHHLPRSPSCAGGACSSPAGRGQADSCGTQLNGPLIPARMTMVTAWDVPQNPLTDPTLDDSRLSKEVRWGYRIFTNTPGRSRTLRAGRGSCNNCHLNAGQRERALPLVDVAGLFPEYNRRAGRLISLDDRIVDCFLRSENATGRPARHRGAQSGASADAADRRPRAKCSPSPRI